MTAGALLALAMQAQAYEVSVGTFVANAGRTIVVPVSLDSAAGLSYASASISYDPQVLVVTKAEAGSLKALMAEDFVSADTNGTVTVSLFGSPDANVASGSGTIAAITFAVREGTAGLYSDLAVVDVELGERTGVLDVTADNPLRTVGGMVRVMAADADVSRLENPQTVAADTSLGSLSLSNGDAIQASDLQTPVVVAGAVAAAGAIPVRAPANGWASGTYALLSTTTAGLTFALDGIEAELSSETAGGVTTYYAAVSIAGEIPVACDVQTLSAGTKNQIRSLLGDRLDGATSLFVTGPTGLVALVADMGIAPSCTVDASGAATAVYGEPELRIVDFNPQNGALRIRVIPAAGNAIVSEIATGYVHVYGTDALGGPMRYIQKVGFDLTPYLKPATIGEAVLNLTLGSHSFFKVKIEDAVKADGEAE